MRLAATSCVILALTACSSATLAGAIDPAPVEDDAGSSIPSTGLRGGERTLWHEDKQKVMNNKEKNTAEQQQPLAQQQLEQSVEGMLDRTALHVRVRLKDEAMPPIVQRCVDDLVGGLLRSGLG